MRTLFTILLTVLVTGCANIHMWATAEEPVKLEPKQSLLAKLPRLDGPPMTVAVYGFRDLTGQMKPNDRLAVFSKAVTQGSEVFLIKSLQDSYNWFRVVERVGLDNRLCLGSSLTGSSLANIICRLAHPVNHTATRAKTVARIRN